MDLPILPQSYQPSVASLVRAVRQGNLMLARMTAEETPLDGAIALTNPRRPEVHMANWAGEVHVPTGSLPEQVLDAIEQHFASHGATCWALVGAAMEWPPALAAAIRQRGYAVPWHSQIWQYHRPALPPAARDATASPVPSNTAAWQIIPARAAYAQIRTLYHAAALQYGKESQLVNDLVQSQIDHLDEPRFEMFIARKDGQVVGGAGIVACGPVGVIDNVFTHPDYRRQGIATALLDHVIEHGRRAMFESIVLECREGSEAESLYRRLSFVPIARDAKYVKVTP